MPATDDTAAVPVPVPAPSGAAAGAGAPEALAELRRQGIALAFTGRLDQAAAITLWPQLAAMLPDRSRTQSADAPTLQRIVLTDATYVDSAGLALLVRLADRLRSAGVTPQIEGAPPGLAELRAAYRLGPELEFPG